MRSVRSLYHAQRGDAKRRGISFELTYEEWYQWWQENLGPNWLNQRGRGKNKYVMARFGDKGPYRLDNIKCITGSANSRETKHSGPSGGRRRNPYNGKVIKLTSKDVLNIYSSKDTQNSLARHYGVSARLVRMIKNRQVWKHTLNGGKGGC